MKKENKYSLLIILAGMFWGTQGLFVIALGDSGLSSRDIAAVRVLTATIAFLLIILVRDRNLFRVRIKDIWLFALSGVISIVGFNIFYYSSISLTSVPVAAVLLYVSPAIVTILSRVFFHEPYSMRKGISLIFAFAGCFFVSGVLGQENRVSILGVVAGLLAAFCYAMYSIFSGMILKKQYHPLTSIVYTFLFASVGMLFIADKKALIHASRQGGAVLLFILFGVISCVLPYFLYTVSLAYIEAGKAAILSSVEAVSATIYSIVFTHNRVQLEVIAGIICVLISVVLVNTKGRDTGCKSKAGRQHR